MSDKTNKKEKPFVSPIGGQALLEGVMMKSPTAAAMAVRDTKGKLAVWRERCGGRRWYNKVPVIRGFFSLLSSLAGSMKYLTKSLEPIAEDDEQLSKGETFFSIALGIILAVGLFAVLPRIVNWSVFELWLDLPAVFVNQKYLYVLITGATSGVLRVGVLVLYMAVIAKMKSIARMYQYHGAEHRTINCYEKHLELTVANVQSCSTRHNRCGTTFLFYTVMVSILVSIAVSFLWALGGVDVWSLTETVGDTAGSLVYNLIIIGSNILLFPVTAGLSYEFLRLMAKAPDNWLTMIFKAPGLALQKLSTKIPDDSQAEAAILAFKTVMLLDEDKSLPNLEFYETDYAAARKMLEEKYAAAGIDEECEVDWLLCEVLGCKRSELHNIKKLNKNQSGMLAVMSGKRAEGTPLDYVTGHSEFYGFRLKVNENVLIPRMDTETTVKCAIDIIGGKAADVLDLMTGSGCIALALAKKTGARVTAADVSDAALEVAKENLAGAAEVIKSDVFAGITDKYDLIISNPPYIRSGEIDGLAKEVRQQPHLALDGGEDGLEFYRRIIGNAPAHLKQDGTLVLEIGYDQAAGVTALLQEHFSDIKIYKDLGGNDRAITAFLKNL